MVSLSMSAAAAELDFPSEAWVQAYKDAINANADYAKAGKDWTHGVVAMVVKAEPSLDIPEDMAMWLDVHEGRCRECKLLPAKEAEAKAPFVVVASYALEAGHQEGSRPDEGPDAGEVEAHQGAHADHGEVRQRLETARRVHVARPDQIPRRVTSLA